MYINQWIGSVRCCENKWDVMKVDDNVFQEKICEDSSSFDLSPADLATAIEELNRLGEKLFEMAKNEETSLVEMTDSSAMPGTVVKHV